MVKTQLQEKKLKGQNQSVGEIPEGWEFRELGSLGKVVTGKTPPTKDNDNFGEGYPFITPRDMIGQKYIRVTERYLTEKGKGAVKNCLLPADAVCVSCIGSDMGNVVMTERPGITNQQLNSLVCEHADPQFAYYGIINIAKNLRDAAFHSTAVPILNKSAFSRFQIFMPKEISEQRAIAKILGDLDEKIELNHRMDKTLEAIAQALFKRWFVDFKFPDEKGRPYKDSGGRMIDSELGEIPEGWKAGKINDCCIRVQNGGTPRRNEPRFWNDGDILWLTSGEVRQPIITTTENFITEAGLAESSAKWVELLSTVIALYGATAGQVSLVSSKLTTNQAVCALIPKKSFCFFNYLWMRNITSELKNKAVGSAQQNISKLIVEETQVVLPSSLVLEKFDEIVYSIFDQWIFNLKQSRTLAVIRDSLLPKLMNGKLRV